MTPLDEFLASVKERAEKATPGPWKSYRESMGPGSAIPNGKCFIVHVLPDGEEIGFCDVQDAGNRDAPFIAHARSDVDRLVAMVEAGQKLSRGIAAEYADQTQGPSETLGKIAMRAEEYDAELDRLAGEDGT
jgi:hypothetical protein